MELIFKISKVELVNCIFARNDKHPKKLLFPSWLRLEKRLWKKFKNEPAYYFINPIHYDWAFGNICAQAEEKGFEKIFSRTGEKIEEIYQEIFRSKEFQTIYSETKQYQNWLKKEWEKKESFIFNYFKNILGLKIPDYKINVHVFHPKLHRGNSNFKARIIQWGHSEDWKNYSVVYLAHELLHILADKKCAEMMHALIELAADNELRIRLNKQGEYFKEGAEDIGHPELRKLEKKILPDWKEFLENKVLENKGGKNIIELEKQIQKKIKRD